jgi:ribosomal protein L28
MARCYICNKRSQTGNKRSHSNVATKRKFKVNIQSKKIDGEKRKICTSCIKTMNKVN